MAGITHGLLAGALVTTALTYATASQFRTTASTVHLESLTAADIWQSRDIPTPLVSNKNTFYKRDVVEGAKDLWNEEVMRAVTWWYGLRVGDKTAAAIAGLFN
jgi:hypothetical protein